MNSFSRIANFRNLYLFLMIIVLLVLFFVKNTTPFRDGDVFFHLKYGEYHLQHKTPLIDHSTFSWTPSHQYIPYCTWAADTFLYVLYTLGGWPILFGFRYVCMLIPLLIVWFYARQTGMAKSIFIPFILILVLLATNFAAYIKPEIFSLVFFSLLAWLYFYVKNQDAAHPKRRFLWLYPLLFLFWANIHGIVFFGLLLLAIIICGELINFYLKSQHAFDKKTMTTLVISGVLSAMVTLLNPYGIDLHHYFLQLSLQGFPEEIKSTLGAYKPLFGNVIQSTFRHMLQYWGIMSSLFAILYLAYIKKTRSWDMGLLLPNLFLAVLSIQIARTNFFWPVFWALSLLYLSSSNHLNLTPMLDRAKPLVKYALIGVLSALSLFLPLKSIHEDYYTPKVWSYFGLGFSYLDPFQESAFLKKHRIGTKLFNTYNTGCYLLFDLFPHYKVFIDTRFFPYTKDDTFGKYWDLTYGRLALEEFESEFKFDIALVEHNYVRINSFITADDWVPVYYGITGVVFAKDHLNPPIDIRKLDPHRFDGVKNALQAFDIARTAQNLNDLETSAYMISVMEKEMRHMTGYRVYHRHLSLWQKGLEAYNRGDHDKALKKLWGVGFGGYNLRVIGLLRQLINKKADMYIKEGNYAKALTLLKPVYQNFPKDSDITYDIAVVTYLAAKENQGDLANNRTRWRELLDQFLDISPEHEYASIARQLLANENMSENLPLVLNSRVKNIKLRTYNLEKEKVH